MRRQIWLIAATVALAAVPATAQNNVAAEPAGNAIGEPTAADNAAVTAAPASNALEPAPATAVPEPASQPPADADEDEDSGRFPWGLIGLVGLVGLLGRRRGATE